MTDWFNRARELQVRDELQRHKHPEPDKARTQKILDSEADWMERVAKRVLEIAEHWVYIQIKRTATGLELKCRGTVQIQLLGHQNFSIKYCDISKPSHVMITSPIKIYHHRIARVRLLNAHNIEEILKFAALGMEAYVEMSTFQRIERNLEELIDALNQNEHVEGLITRKKKD